MWATLLQIQAPECAWCRHASTHHPEVALAVTSYHAHTDGLAIEVVELTGPTWGDVVKELETLPSVDEVQVIDGDARRGRIRVAARECALPHAIKASGIVPELPFSVSGGCDRWLLLSPQARAKDFYESLRDQKVDVEVVYAGEYHPETRLTPRQQEILDFAISKGYYDYPRRITLTNLADMLGIAKSTLSQTIMLVESEIVKRASTGQAPR